MSGTAKKNLLAKNLNRAREGGCETDFGFFARDDDLPGRPRRAARVG